MCHCECGCWQHGEPGDHVRVSCGVLYKCVLVELCGGHPVYHYDCGVIACVGVNRRVPRCVTDHVIEGVQSLYTCMPPLFLHSRFVICEDKGQCKRMWLSDLINRASGALGAWWGRVWQMLGAGEGHTVGMRT